VNAVGKEILVQAGIPTKVKLGWQTRDYVVDEGNPSGRMLSAEELEQERERAHLFRPVGVGRGSGSGTSLSIPGHDSETGAARGE
jgi:hypothetical protein